MNKDIWVFVEQRNGMLETASLKLLGEGRRLANQVGGRLCAVVLAGQGEEDLETDFVGLDADAVYLVEDEALVTYNVCAYTNVLADLIKTYDPLAMLFATTPMGQDLAPRLATRLGISLVTECVRLEMSEEGSLTVRRRLYGGQVEAIYTCDHTPHLATVTEEAMVTKPGKGGNPAIMKIQPEMTAEGFGTELVRRIRVTARDMDVREANVVVGVGLGVGGPEHLDMMWQLADLLGGTLAASRPVADLGRLPRERHIGQTGKTISPELYIACGISGALEHVAGIDSGFVVAINTDREARIFQVADLGIVKDVHQVVPRWIEDLSERLGQESQTNR